VWTEWEDIDYTTQEKSERRLEFLRELNEYAVKERGQGAKREFRACIDVCDQCGMEYCECGELNEL